MRMKRWKLQRPPEVDDHSEHENRQDNRKVEVQTSPWWLKKKEKIPVCSLHHSLCVTHSNRSVGKLIFRKTRRLSWTKITHKNEYENETKINRLFLREFPAVYNSGRSLPSRSEETVPITWRKEASSSPLCSHGRRDPRA